MASSHSCTLCLRPRGILASIFKDVVVDGDVFPLLQMSLQRLPTAHAQPARTALWCAATVSVQRLMLLFDALPLRVLFKGL